MEVTLEQMLLAREQRAQRQQALLARFGRPLICFTMNIAGPVKQSPEIAQGFSLGCAQLRSRLAVEKIECLYTAETREDTGCEAFFVLDAPGERLKAVTTELEERSALGRLFDMDVILPGGEKLERFAPRRCLICGEPAQACGRSRSHSVAQLQEKTRAILRQAIDEADIERAGELAVRALLYEVAVTPKPGLVDRENNGSHRDMDFFSFLSSAAAMQPYFCRCTRIGRESAHLPGPETLARLRLPGKEAEGEMYRATGGVNTHKGAIFSLGILCGALGRLSRHQWSDSGSVLAECAAMAKGIVAGDFTEESNSAPTAGQTLYARYGITGVRGQAEQGFPAVREAGLPALETGLAKGLSLNDAACGALLAILCAAEDTCMISRSDVPTQRAAAEEIRQLLAREPYPEPSVLSQLDAVYRQKNLSPGGSADLLAMSLILHFLKENDK